MVDIAEGSPIVALRSTTAEGEIMVLHISGSGDCLAEIGIKSLIAIFQPKLLRSSDVFGGIQHLHTLEHRLDAIVALVRNLKSLTRSLLGLHLDNARSTTRTIKSGLTGILQHGKAFDISRIYRSKRCYIRGYTIDDDQWVVAAHDGSGTTNPHRVEHGNTVETIGSNVYTSRLSIQGIKGIIEYALLQQFRLHHAHRTV